MQLQRVGILIKEGRTRKGMTQTELAKLLHVSVAAVSKWETGKNIPDMSNMERVARILDIPVHELLGISSAGAEILEDAENPSENALGMGEEGEGKSASDAGSESAAEPEAAVEEETESAPSSHRAARVSFKKMRLGILLAILAGICTGGILSWNARASFAQPKVTIVADFCENTVYGSTQYVVMEYEEEPTSDFLNRQAVGFKSEHPEYFKRMDAVFLLYYKKYDALRDDESTADFMVVILN